MIPAVLLFASPSQAVPSEEARVRQFYQRVTAPYGKPIEPFKPNEVPTVTQPKGDVRFRTYQFAYGSLFVEPKNGRVIGGGFGQPIDYLPARRDISDAQAVALARKYVRATGYEPPIDAYRVTDQQGNNQVGIQVDFVPTYRGVDFSRYASGYVIVHRGTGHLESLYMPRGPLPKPPAEVRPAFDREEALVRAIASILGRGEPVVQVSPSMQLHLAIVPNPRQAGSGRLVYAMQAGDPRRIYRTYGQPDRGFYTEIDARSGSAKTSPLPLAGGPRRSLRTPMPAASSAWRLGRDVRGLLGRKVEGKVSPASSAGFRARRSAYLIDGEHGWRIEVGDEGRFRVREADEARTYFQASGELGAALRSLTAK